MMAAGVIAAEVTATGTVGAVVVAELIRRWKSRRDTAAADSSSRAEIKRADAELVTGIAEAFQKLVGELQEELGELRSERKAWAAERHDLRNEVAKLRGLVSRLTKQLKAHGFEPVLED